MIRRFNIIYILIFLTSCENNQKNNTSYNGESLYKKNCASCHQIDGKGTGPYPPLADSDYLLSDIDRSIRSIIYGVQDSIIVNGKEYGSGLMAPFHHLSDDEIAKITTYILNSWGNNGGVVTSSRVSLNR